MSNTTFDLKEIKNLEKKLIVINQQPISTTMIERKKQKFKNDNCSSKFEKKALEYKKEFLGKI